MEPLVSVVIAAYQPGDGFDRVMTSLDEQTLPQDRFETIVVDDGSPDDTFERLQARAATRPNMRVERIENSGWPSRPRNVGTDLARAPYVLYVDHDDKLFPDALRRLVEYAAETGADVVSAKESQTRSAWWGTMPFRGGNVANVVPGGDIHQLMPMIPHKLYRRAFLAEHGIRFPEGKRQLWEDIFFNVAVWRHAEVVALLADTPVYLWVLTRTNNSSTYGPGGMEFWDRMEVLLEFIDRTLDGEAFARARQDEVLHQWRGRALKRFSKLAGTAPGEKRLAKALPRAQALQARWVPAEHDRLLGMIAHPYSVLTRAGDVERLGALWNLDQTVKCRFTASGVRWRDGVLEADVVARWVDQEGRPLRVIRRDGRLLRDLPDDIAAALPVEAYDVTEMLDTFVLRVGAHSRREHLTWDVRVDDPRTAWEDLEPGVVTPVSRGRMRFDAGSAAGGRALTPSVWELSGIVHWSDTSRSQGLRVKVAAMPALPGGIAAVAYTNKAGTLAVDLTGRSRNLVAEGGLRSGRVHGGVTRFEVPLPLVRSWGAHRVPVTLRLQTKRNGTTDVDGTVVTDGQQARLVAGGVVAPGRYKLAFVLPDGVDRTTRWSAVVSRGGGLVLRDRSRQPSRRTIVGLVRELRRVAGAARRRLRR